MYNSNSYNAYQGSDGASHMRHQSAKDMNFYGSQYANTNIAGAPTGANPQFGANPQAAATSIGGPPFFENLSGSMENQYMSNPSYGSGGSGGDANQLPKGILAAFSTSGYPGEPPLLEELDINFLHIKIKTLAVLNPFSSSQVFSMASGNVNILNDSDLGGPIFFALLYGVNLLLAGKIHFGYIYGCGLLGTLSIFALFKLMSNNNIPNQHKVDPAVAAPNTDISSQSDLSKPQDLNYSRTTSILGYCLLPLVLLSLLGIVVTLDNFWGYVLSILCTFWSTYSASGLFVMVLNLQDSRFLIAYPLLLFYSIFALMAIFVENS